MVPHLMGSRGRTAVPRIGQGVTHLFVHSAKQDQLGVIDFFGRQVSPLVRNGAEKGASPVSAV